MTRWIESIAAHIEANALGAQGTSLFIQEMPETDDDGPTTVIAVERGTTMLVGGNGKVDMPGLLVGVRASTFGAAWDQCEAVRELLRAITNTTIQGTYFLGVAADGPLEDAGRDEKSRRQIMCRFVVAF